VIFYRVLLVLVLFPFVSVHADRCKKSVALLGSEPESSREVPREEVLDQIAGLYSAAINGEASMEAALMKMNELAERELRSISDVRHEIELLLNSPRERHERAEERRAHREKEQSHFYESLEPYLARIGHEHRKIIEEEILRRGLVNPLTTGEVEFRFHEKHTFLVGDEGLMGANRGKTKNVSFGSGNDFAMGQVPVTQFIYLLAALGENDVDPTPSRFKKGEGSVSLQLGSQTYFFKPNHPVESVSYDGAEAHAARVSEIIGVSYSLPTLTQWEFVNRAGSEGMYHFGDDALLLPSYGWFKLNSRNQTQAIGQLSPNAFGLYDTHGNVWEVTSSAHGQSFILAGGGWYSNARNLRSAYHSLNVRGSFSEDVGFRLQREIGGSVRPSHTISFRPSGPDSNPGSVMPGGPR
jgi:hypothetical protein